MLSNALTMTCCPCHASYDGSLERWLGQQVLPTTGFFFRDGTSVALPTTTAPLLHGVEPLRPLDGCRASFMRGARRHRLPRTAPR